MTNPHTFTQVATYRGNIAELVSRFSPDFRRIVSPLGQTKPMGLYVHTPKPYLMIFSQSLDGSSNTLEGVTYNCILTATSDEAPLNLRLAREFQDKTGIDLRTAPNSLIAIMNNIGLISFPTFKRVGPLAMEVIQDREH
ncbi:Uncharacterised protein [uncultured archaeon]|nr:Uncharacterised protein [uncultured archaeon]